MREAVIERILSRRLIAIIRGVDGERCLELARAISAGGIDMVEVTFNQSDPDSFRRTAEAISAVNERLGGDVLAGAGTVLTAEQVRLAADAGAKYIISPNVSRDVIETAGELGLASIPGAMTPTEIMQAHEYGADFVKVFPAGPLGSGYVKAVLSPLSHIRLLAVGGVDTSNIPAFLQAGCVGFGVGGNLVNKSWIDAGEFDKITETSRAFCRAAR
jgi:2-dehydro-3-deoxyphosphogluconate aldolase/(4S)-4-hydroxy-2-oxoglutarate aldolase